MSLYYVNANLISEDENVTHGEWAQTHEAYDRTMIRTTTEAVRKKEDGTFEPFSRILCAHNCSSNPAANTRISSTMREGDYAPRITIRTSSDTRYNSDVFVVAIPYEGIIMPFEHDEEALEIFRSTFIKSDKFSINHENKTYRRVAYFVCKPNYQYLGNDGVYADECNLVVTFAQSSKTRKDEKPENWELTTMTVRFGADGAYEIESKQSTMPYDEFDPESIRGKGICNLVVPRMVEANNQGNNGGKNAKGKKNH